MSGPVEELQVRIEHQELAIEKLSETVAAQSRLLIELREEIARLRDRLREVQPSPLSDSAGHEPPPHY